MHKDMPTSENEMRERLFKNKTKTNYEFIIACGSSAPAKPAFSTPVPCSEATGIDKEAIQHKQHTHKQVNDATKQHMEEMEDVFNLLSFQRLPRSLPPPPPHS